MLRNTQYKFIYKYKMKKNKFIYIKTDFYLFIFIIYSFIDILLSEISCLSTICYHSRSIYLYHYREKTKYIVRKFDKIA